MGASVRPGLPSLLDDLKKFLARGKPVAGTLPPAVVQAGQRNLDFDALTQGGLADTLFAALGRPASIELGTQPTIPRTLGEQRGVPGIPGVSASRDTIDLDRRMVAGKANEPTTGIGLKSRGPVEKEQKDWVFSHEMGHRYLPTAANGLVLQRWATLHRANVPVDAYSRMDTEEAFAQSVANAVDVLRNTKEFEPAHKDLLFKVLEAREKDTPGFAVLIEDLLDKDIYAKHPLKKEIKKWAADAYKRVVADTEKRRRKPGTPVPVTILNPQNRGY